MTFIHFYYLFCFHDFNIHQSAYLFTYLIVKVIEECVEGTDIGLFVTNRIVEDNGGRIEVKCEVGLLKVEHTYNTAI